MARAGRPSASFDTCAAAGEPAHLAVQQQGAVFGLVLGAGVDGGAQGQNHGFQVFGVDGGHPFLAGEREPVAGQADEIEEQRRCR